MPISFARDGEMSPSLGRMRLTARDILLGNARGWRRRLLAVDSRYLRRYGRHIALMIWFIIIIPAADGREVISLSAA